MFISIESIEWYMQKLYILVIHVHTIYTGINEKLHTSIETYMYVEMYNSF